MKRGTNERRLQFVSQDGIKRKAYEEHCGKGELWAKVEDALQYAEEKGWRVVNPHDQPKD